MITSPPQRGTTTGREDRSVVVDAADDWKTLGQSPNCTTSGGNRYSAESRPPVLRTLLGIIHRYSVEKKVELARTRSRKTSGFE